MDFEDEAGLAKLEALPAQGLDDLPFGVVRMREDGEVVAYNTWEAEMAGLAKEQVLTRNFFSEVAPCTNNYLIAERFRSEPELDVIVEYIFTLRMKPTPVTLRLLRSAAIEHMYLLVKR